MRTVRLTNYHQGAVARFYWKRKGARKFQEIKLRGNNIGTNQYEDFSLPYESVQVCVQSPDGFRLWWQKVKKDAVALDIVEDEPNWAKGKCKDLN